MGWAWEEQGLNQRKTSLFILISVKIHGGNSARDLAVLDYSGLTRLLVNNLEALKLMWNIFGFSPGQKQIFLHNSQLELLQIKDYSVHIRFAGLVKQINFCFPEVQAQRMHLAKGKSPCEVSLHTGQEPSRS